jgi:beta-lactamase class A
MNGPQKPSFAWPVNEAHFRRDPAKDFNMYDRRSTVAGALALVVAACTARANGRASTHARYSQQLHKIEEQGGGRLGAFVFDPARGSGFGWRQDERFAHCSSFKLSLAALALAKADRGEVDLANVLHWTPGDLLPNSPVTTVHVSTGLPIGELARAMQVTSDNTAANVLLRRFGGPQELTRFWRSLGDQVSRLDRYEPELNSVPPGTELDTTTPAAMAKTLAALLLDEHLSPSSRATLKRWMVETETGLERLRAGLPPTWEAGDKTGTGLGDTRHTYVDIAFGGPTGRTPLVIAAYFEPARRLEAMDPLALRALAEVGRVAAASWSS